MSRRSALCLLPLLLVCLLHAAQAQTQGSAPGAKPPPAQSPASPPPPAKPAPVPHVPEGTVPAGTPPAAAPPVTRPPATANSPAAASNPAPASGPREGGVRWLKGTPAAGAPVRLRLRGAALSAVLDPAVQWSLVAVTAINGQVAATPVPAQLELPAFAPTPTPQQLTILKRSDPTAADSWVILDRGTSPALLDHLRVQLADTKFSQALRIEAGDNLSSFVSAGPPQLLFQALRNGDLVTLDTVGCTVGHSRYLRLTLPGGGALRIDAVSGWAAPPFTELYTVPATLGAMHRDNVSASSVWPLLLTDPRLPLARLKLNAAPEANGQSRNVRIVRLAADGSVLSSGSSRPWAQQLNSGDVQRDERWLDLPPAVQPQPYGIAVADGSDPPLQLTSVNAYAAEVCLTCTAPAQGELRLQLRPAAANAPPVPPAQPGAAPPAPGQTPASEAGTPSAAAAASRVIDGEINSLVPLTTPTPTAAANRGKSPLKLPFSLPVWTSSVAFGLPGVLLLLWGLSLLRRPKPTL